MAEVSKQVLVAKGTAFWCDPFKPNNMSSKYQMDLGRLSQETVKALRAAGMAPNFDSKTDREDPMHKGFYIKIKSEHPVTVRDMANKELPSALKIGNGSEVYAAFRAKPWTHKESGRSGVSASWLGLKVVSLVKYDPDQANRAKADNLLDEISGEGFVFGEEGETPAVSDAEADAVFANA